MMLVPSFFNDNFTNDVFGDLFNYPKSNKKYDSNSNMLVDIKEFKDRFEMDIDLPGFNKDEITLELEKGYLTISAVPSKKEENSESKGRFIRCERFKGSNRRAFYVGEEITQADIKAKFENGVLAITIMKKKPVPKNEKDNFISILG
ncbi:Hsp20/alpha crystallin family protein [Lachnobacterium bovis]|uniref:Molecular chaperone IbpA, HSP20 family n=1 Tax=Lachnobacterium bovis DSM 14045 TaxID=1122142 RepID=A0A1H3HWJ4_9FIRM|nr:Hsp20/alpha crystallin family protein [Lachnobacterium bovis]SDY19114.1 Molecular chaperone IbpA, HSP20 family [Lachnobacterium bovis DSM 14045]